MGLQCFNVEEKRIYIFCNLFYFNSLIKISREDTKLENLSFTLSYKECRGEVIPVKNNALTRVNLKINFLTLFIFLKIIQSFSWAATSSLFWCISFFFINFEWALCIQTLWYILPWTVYVMKQSFERLINIQLSVRTCLNTLHIWVLFTKTLSFIKRNLSFRWICSYQVKLVTNQHDAQTCLSLIQ